MQREQEYFQSVYEATYQDLLRYVVIQTKKAGDVEDIMQNAYTKFYGRIQKRGHNDIVNVRAFLMTIVQQELKTYYRFRLRKKQHEQVMPEDDQISGNVRLEEEAVNRDLLQKVWLIIEKAPAQSYKAFVLHYYFGQSVPEIAKALSLTESNISSRLYRLRQTIRARMAKEEQA